MKTTFVILDRLLEGLVFATLACMVAVVAVNVFYRFVLKFSLSWGDEVAMMLMVWFTFLGAALGMRDRAHYAFDFLIKSLPVKAKKSVSAFSQIICILMATGLCYWSGKVTFQIRHWVMPATEISRALVYGAAPVGSFFIIIYAIRNFVNDLIVKKPTVIDKKEEAGKMTMEAAEEKGLI